LRSASMRSPGIWSDCTRFCTEKSSDRKKRQLVQTVFSISYALSIPGGRPNRTLSRRALLKLAGLGKSNANDKARRISIIVSPESKRSPVRWPRKSHSEIPASECAPLGAKIIDGRPVVQAHTGT
jgi:hypothetical protein